MAYYCERVKMIDIWVPQCDEYVRRVRGDRTLSLTAVTLVRITVVCQNRIKVARIQLTIDNNRKGVIGLTNALHISIKALFTKVVDILETHFDDVRNWGNYPSRVLFV